MNSVNSALDLDGNILQEDDVAILIAAPNELLFNLPVQDQEAIKSQVGKEMQVQGFDEFGYVELAFQLQDNEFTFIWVKPSFLKKKL